MDLTKEEEGKQYTIARIETQDPELDSFLFSLGCYSGEPITVISRRRGSCTIAVKDGRYSIINFNITDYTSSYPIKVFGEKKK